MEALQRENEALKLEIRRLQCLLGLSASPSPDPRPLTVATLVGNGTKGWRDDERLDNAQLCVPTGLALSPSDGSVVWSDFKGQRLRRLSPDRGRVWTVAGDGNTGYRDAGDPLVAQFDDPWGIAFEPDGNALLVCDLYNHRIRRVTERGVTTLAGTGEEGGKDGAALSASFSGPCGVAVDPQTADIYVAEYTGCRVRRIEHRSGAVSLVAGSADSASGYADECGSKALFNYPYGLCFDAGRRILFVADCCGHKIRQVALDGQCSTIALCSYPACVATGEGGSVFTAEYDCNRILDVTPQQPPTMLAGSMQGAHGLANGRAAESLFFYPHGLLWDPSHHSLLVTDSYNHCIREITGF